MFKRTRQLGRVENQTLKSLFAVKLSLADGFTNNSSSRSIIFRSSSSHLYDLLNFECLLIFIVLPSVGFLMPRVCSNENFNKTGTSKVGAISNAQKAQNIFFGKNLKFLKKNEKKIERGDSLVPSGFLGYLEKVKNERGTLCTKFALALLPDWAS